MGLDDFIQSTAPEPNDEPQAIDLSSRVQIGPAIPLAYQRWLKSWCFDNDVTIDATVTGLIAMLIDKKVNPDRLLNRIEDLESQRRKQARQKRRSSY
jgi:hypothetical protein